MPGSEREQGTHGKAPMTKIYAARWLLSDAEHVAEPGAVAVAGERIAGAGARDEVVAQFPGAPIEDFGEAAIMPGLVNCHSHLELTAMRGFLEDEEGDFPAWLRKLTAARMLLMTEDDLYVSAAWGAVEAARAGVTCVGDAASSGATSLRALCDVGLRGTIYQELFGPAPEAAEEQLAGLREKIAALRGLENGRVRAGVSPHAPYTVSAPLLEAASSYAVAEKLPLMIHAAESEAEVELIKHGRGFFAEDRARRGLPWETPGVSPIQYLKRCGVLRARPLLAHCVRVDEADIEAIREAGASVAHCPKSNLKLGHGPAPLAAMRGIARGLGSDSVASNNTCDMLEEARFAALLARGFGGRAPGDSYGAHEALFDATTNGATALGFGGLTGELAAGLQADLAVVRLDGAHQTPVYDPVRALVFASSGRDVVLTVVAGREVYRDGRVTTIDEDRLRARIRGLRGKLNSSGF